MSYKSYKIIIRISVTIRSKKVKMMNFVLSNNKQLIDYNIDRKLSNKIFNQIILNYDHEIFDSSANSLA